MLLNFILWIFLLVRRVWNRETIYLYWMRIGVESVVFKRDVFVRGFFCGGIIEFFFSWRVIYVATVWILVYLFVLVIFVRI